MGLFGIAFLAIGALLAGAAPRFFQTSTSPIEKDAKPPSDSIQEKVHRALANDALEDEDAIRELFLLGDEAVLPLIRFLHDPNEERRAGAARGLAYIGNQQGIQALRIASKTERDKETKSAIACFLAGGLVDTKSEHDLNYLRTSVERARFVDDDDKEFPAFCAALALAMRGRKDSLPLLQKVAKADVLDSDEIEKSILWIQNKSASGQVNTGPASNDEELIKRFVLDGTFFAEKQRDKTSVEQITFNSARNRVLVSVEIYLSRRDARGYDVVLAKESGVWRVVGIWFAWVA